MVCEPFGSRHDGVQTVVFWLDLPFFLLDLSLLDVSCLSGLDLSLLGLSLPICFSMF